MGSNDKSAEERRPSQLSRSHYRDDGSYESNTLSSSGVQVTVYPVANRDNPNSADQEAATEGAEVGQENFEDPLDNSPPLRTHPLTAASRFSTSPTTLRRRHHSSKTVERGSNDKPASSKTVEQGSDDKPAKERHHRDDGSCASNASSSSGDQVTIYPVANRDNPNSADQEAATEGAEVGQENFEDLEDPLDNSPPLRTHPLTTAGRFSTSPTTLHRRHHSSKTVERGSNDKPTEKRRPSQLNRSHYRDDGSYESDASPSSGVQVTVYPVAYRDDPSSVPRRRHHSSETVERDIAQGRPNVLSYCWNMLKWVQGFSWKRALVLSVGVYCCLLFVSHLLAHFHKFARSYWDTAVCSREVSIFYINVAVGTWMPGCSTYSDRSLNLTKMVTTQEELGKVASQIGQSYGLITRMVDDEFAVRDLKIRVSKSKLSQRESLVKELESISQSTKEASKYMSHFTVKYNKLIEKVDDFNQRAISKLGHLTESRRNPTLLAQIVSAANPLALFGSSWDEDQAKEIIIITAAKISADVQPLLKQGRQISHTLDRITGALDEIRQLTIDELGTLPRHHWLRVLWEQIAPSEDYAQFKSHASLLEELVNSHEAVSAVIKHTITALLLVEAELESIRDEYATPALIMQDDSIDDVLETFVRAARGLKRAKTRLEQGGDRLELGGRVT